MYTFGQLAVGDMFNTKAARWVKTTATYAVCVMSGTNHVGQQCLFKLSDEVIVLWSNNQQINAVCTELLEKANLAQQAAEFKQSLIDERDALIARRACVKHYSESGKPGDPESYWLSEQYNVMCQYIVALDARLDLLHKSAKTNV